LSAGLSSGYFHAVLVCGLGCGLALFGEYRQQATITTIGKLIAASAYMVAAVTLGAIDTPYGRLLLCAMAFCWVGDLLLVSRRSRGLFLSGLTAFLLGHVVYSVAFSVRGIEVEASLLAAGLMGLFTWRIMAWLKPHLDARMTLPVLAYILAISVMMATAAGSWAGMGSLALLSGAALFVLSDISVARNRLVAPGFINRAIGLPIYFTAQLLLAATVAV
jgi:uncharacterized membrane protein YhhN